MSGATGVASPFILILDQSFADCVTAERVIHQTLDRCNLRYARNREFFQGPVSDIVRVVVHYAIQTGDDAVTFPERTGMELLAQGDKFLFGDLDTPQDLKEALRCYQIAAARGSLVAFERLGAILAQAQNQTRSGKTRALAYLREGARRGNYYCYCEMATLAAADGNAANFRKAWELFFVHRQAATTDEVEAGAHRYLATLQRYVVACFSLGIEPEHEATIRLQGDALSKMLTETGAMMRHSPGTRRHVIQAQRWTKGIVLAPANLQCARVRRPGWLQSWLEKWRTAPA